MNDSQTIRTENRLSRIKCQSRILRSGLAVSVTKTLGCYLDNIGSATHYIYCFKSQRELARERGCAVNTIEFHTRILKKAGLIIVKALNNSEASLLLAGFGFKKKLFFKDRLNFVSINQSHPFWGLRGKAQDDVVVEVGLLLKARYEKASKAETPFDGRGETPFDGRGETPFDGRGKLFKEEDILDTPSISSSEPDNRVAMEQATDEISRRGSIQVIPSANVIQAAPLPQSQETLKAESPSSQDYVCSGLSGVASSNEETSDESMEDTVLEEVESQTPSLTQEGIVLELRKVTAVLVEVSGESPSLIKEEGLSVDDFLSLLDD